MLARGGISEYSGRKPHSAHCSLLIIFVFLSRLQFTPLGNFCLHILKFGVFCYVLILVFFALEESFVCLSLSLLCLFKRAVCMGQ